PRQRRVAAGRRTGASRTTGAPAPGGSARPRAAAARPTTASRCRRRRRGRSTTPGRPHRSTGRIGAVAVGGSGSCRADGSAVVLLVEVVVPVGVVVPGLVALLDLVEGTGRLGLGGVGAQAVLGAAALLRLDPLVLEAVVELGHLDPFAGGRGHGRVRPHLARFLDFLS